MRRSPVRPRRRGVCSGRHAHLAGSKGCYRAGDALILSGAGYTPNGPANIDLEGSDLGS